jgi:hypothetical protein
MPKRSERQTLLSDITKALTLSILDDESDDFFAESPVDELFELTTVVEMTRYITKRCRVPKAIDFRCEVFAQQPDVEFRETVRTSRASFYHIVELLSSHPVFHNQSRYPQAPVWQQVAVALDRFGNNGNGASISRTQKYWGIGKGTCDLYTNRTMEAIQYVRWPNEQERRQISQRMSTQGFIGCVGFIDGTTIPLAQKPGVDGECYFDRKQRYSLNAQVVCDDRRIFLRLARLVL